MSIHGDSLSEDIFGLYSSPGCAKEIQPNAIAKVKHAVATWPKYKHVMIALYMYMATAFHSSSIQLFRHASELIVR